MRNNSSNYRRRRSSSESDNRFDSGRNQERPFRDEQLFNSDRNRPQFNRQYQDHDLRYNSGSRGFNQYDNNMGGGYQQQGQDRGSYGNQFDGERNWRQNENFSNRGGWDRQRDTGYGDNFDENDRDQNYRNQGDLFTSGGRDRDFEEDNSYNRSRQNSQFDEDDDDYDEYDPDYDEFEDEFDDYQDQNSRSESRNTNWL
jgi:hypothetical protein